MGAHLLPELCFRSTAATCFLACSQCGSCFSIDWNSDGQISSSDLRIGFQATDGVAVDDLPFVDDGDVTGNAQTEVHVLLGEQNARARTPQPVQNISNPLHHDWR